MLSVASAATLVYKDIFGGMEVIYTIYSDENM